MIEEIVIYILGLVFSAILLWDILSKGDITIAKKKKKIVVGPAYIWKILFFGIFFGLIFSKIYSIVRFFPLFSKDPLSIFFLLNLGNGLLPGLLGAVFGVVVFSLIYFKENYFSLLKQLLDKASLYIPIVLALLSWSAYFSYFPLGLPTNLPWAIEVPFSNRPHGFKLFETFHPLFIYESLLYISLFFLLMVFGKIIKKEQKFNGLQFLLFFMGYLATRLIIEPLNLYSWRIYSFPVNSALAIFGLFVTALLAVKQILQTLSLPFYRPPNNKPH